jgi:hypothetical protein
MLVALVVTESACGSGSGGHSPATLDHDVSIGVDGVIGGIHSRETRPEVERTLLSCKPAIHRGCDARRRRDTWPARAGSATRRPLSASPFETANVVGVFMAAAADQRS